MPRPFEFKYSSPIEPVALDPTEDCFRTIFDNQNIHSSDGSIYTSIDGLIQYIYSGDYFREIFDNRNIYAVGGVIYTNSDSSAQYIYND